MTRKHFAKSLRVLGLFCLVDSFAVNAQTDISSQCFDAMHDASYATTADQVRVSVAYFVSLDCELYFKTAYKASGGVPPKGAVNPRALLAMAYESAKRRAATTVSPIGPGGTTTAGKPGGGVVFSLPRNLEEKLGGNAVFLPSNKLSKEMLLELQKSGALAVQK